jgi:Rieske Fe-S protein
MRWREDFPVGWEDDRYVTRRELAKFLTLGSGLLAAASGLMAVVGLGARRPATPPQLVARIDEVPPGGSKLFRYPTPDDPCILLRDAEGRFEAFSQVCTHLSCAVVHDAADATLRCPCHRGVFAASDGRPLAGPPTRPLPRIRIERQGQDVVALGVEV